MKLLTNKLNPNTVINAQQIQSIYPHVYSSKCSTQTVRPFVIDFTFGGFEDNYVSWAFDNPHDWLEALIGLELGSLTEQYIELIKNAGRDYPSLKS